MSGGFKRSGLFGILGVVVVAEFQLPTRIGSAHGGDPRLLPISSLLTVTGAIALTVFDPAAAQNLEQRLSADAVEAASD